MAHPEVSATGNIRGSVFNNDDKQAFDVKEYLQKTNIHTAAKERPNLNLGTSASIMS